MQQSHPFRSTDALLAGLRGIEYPPGPCHIRLNFGVPRNFPFGAKRRFEFRGETFNLFNPPYLASRTARFKRMYR